MIFSVQVEFQKDYISVKEDKIRIGIKSKPIKGEANKEIVKKLARYFQVSTSCVIIRSGHKSKQKIIEVLS